MNKRTLQEIREIHKEISAIGQGRTLDQMDIQDLQTIYERYQEIESHVFDENENIPTEELQRQIQEAEEILGSENVFGAKAIKKAFGIAVSMSDIPALPFMRDDLLVAKELDQFLVLRVDMAQDGEDLTMRKINSLLKGSFEKRGKGHVLYDKEGWKKYEEFFIHEKPRYGWALVNKQVIEGSQDHDFMAQTDMVVNFLTAQVFANKVMPDEYSAAISEFENSKALINEYIHKDWQKATQILESLKISQLTRQTPVEFLYDTMMFYQGTKQRLYEAVYAWTSRRASDGELIDLGRFDERGVDISSWWADRKNEHLVVNFARRS